MTETEKQQTIEEMMNLIDSFKLELNNYKEITIERVQVSLKEKKITIFLLHHNEPKMIVLGDIPHKTILENL
jgi:hypothetical protein